MTTSIPTVSASARAAGLLLALALGACATLNEQECRAADWEALGRAEGARGAPAAAIEDQRAACAKHGVTLQEVAWRVGHAKGVEEFCTPRGGYLAGRSARRVDPKLCAGKPQEEAFNAALRDGKDIAKLIGELRTLRQALGEFELQSLSGELSDRDMQQVNQRVAALDEAIAAREWEIERRDEEYSRQYGAPSLKEESARER